MTDLSSRELIDAIVRSLKRTGRRFARPKAARATKKTAKAPARAAKARAPSVTSRKKSVRHKHRT